jgi:hypothetical protein
VDKDRSPAPGGTTGQELEPRHEPLFPVPLVGELVDLGEPAAVARGLHTVRQAKRDLDDARRVLEAVLQRESERVGSRTLRYGQLEAVVSGGNERVEYPDPQELAEQLRAAGLPEERISEVVVEVVDYRVKRAVLRSVIASNDRYAAAAEAAGSTTQTPLRVAIKRGGTR